MFASRSTLLAAALLAGLVPARAARADEPTAVATSSTATPTTDPDPPTTAPEPVPPPARGVAPEEASGIAIDEPPSTAERLRWIPRALLFLPRWGFWVAAQPLRGAAWTYEVTRDKLKGALFSADQIYGLYPVASYSTDYGFSVGARFVHYDVFGQKEKVKLFADFGGEFRQGYGLKLSSGERIAKRFTANFEARFQRRPGERFFGFGDNTELEAPPEMPIDPMTSNVAIASRFREDIMRMKTYLDTKIARDLYVRVTGAWADRAFGDSDVGGESIADRYDTTRLVGFDDGTSNIYVETELIYDSRRPTNPYISRVMDATGWYLSAFTGRARGLADDTTSYYRYGGEVQRYIDLYKGSRVLTLRAMVDAVGGTDGRTDGKISFVELPRLGGPDFLRGYPRDRFRDGAVALATAEYAWDLGNYFGGYAFVDVGRPFPSLSEVELTGLRMGFGGGIEMRTYRSFLLRGQLAASKDGDVFFELALSPAFGRRERAGRF
ncbi:MAG: hypothetical protein JNL83_20425 [Myxococcales bacterium]|nr:hypothetical protein [Myxococcales bacterium]